MVDTVAQLEAEYCPPLDTALLSAILSDFDLTLEGEVENAKAVLDPLKEHALLEESLGFDASGTGAYDETRLDSMPGTSASASRETDITSLSNGLSSLDLENGDPDSVSSDSSTGKEIENLDEDAKIQLLLRVFQQEVSRYNAQYTLRKCNGKWHKAMEELLNHVYLNDENQGPDGGKVPRGIEAFSEDNVIRRGRKKKAKGKMLVSLDERRSSSLPGLVTDAPAPPTNKWHTATQDIEFIASRTGVSHSSVSSIYYANGASLPKAIVGVLKDALQNEEQDSDPILAVNAHDLGTEFPAIADGYVRTLVRLTHPSTAAAHELARALVTQPQTARGGIQIIPTYTRPQLDTDAPCLQTSRTRHEGLLSSPREISNPSERAAHYSTARSNALLQAYAAHRKAKSDRLMGGAAAYYGQVSRDMATRSSQASAAAADELATSQSAASQLDLHGIDVLNGVRIAREKVDQWWEGLGETRVDGRRGAEERRVGYRIIVGLGRHSEGGKGKLGPAVSKALKQEGWRVEQDGAVIVVRGPR